MVEEVELLEAGRPRVEVDLVADDGVLKFAECKSSAKAAPKTAEIEKKAWAAHLLQADELVFATTDPSWPTGFAARVTGVVDRLSWSAQGAPRVRLISALSHDGEPNDVYPAARRG